MRATFIVTSTVVVFLLHVSHAEATVRRDVNRELERE